MGDLEKLASFYKELFKVRKVDMGSITQRVLFQKVVYLAREIGLGFDEYKYGWYVHGPYAPTLATDGYAIYASDKDYCTHKFTEPELEKIETLKQLFSNEIEEKDSNKFELYVSLLFCRKDNMPDGELLKKIKEKKSWYSEKEIHEGIKKIKELKSMS